MAHTSVKSRIDNCIPVANLRTRPSRAASPWKYPRSFKFPNVHIEPRLVAGRWSPSSSIIAPFRGSLRNVARGPKNLATRDVHITGEFDEAQRKRLAQIAERCPVHKMLAHGVESDDNATFEPTTEPQTL